MFLLNVSYQTNEWTSGTPSVENFVHIKFEKKRFFEKFYLFFLNCFVGSEFYEFIDDAQKLYERRW